MLKAIGVQFMDPKYKMHLNTISPIFLQISFFSLLIYTIYYYRNEPLKAIHPSPALGFFVPVSNWSQYESNLIEH